MIGAGVAAAVLAISGGGAWWWTHRHRPQNAAQNTVQPAIPLLRSLSLHQAARRRRRAAASRRRSGRARGTGAHQRQHHPDGRGESRARGHSEPDSQLEDRVLPFGDRSDPALQGSCSGNRDRGDAQSQSPPARLPSLLRCGCRAFRRSASHHHDPDRSSGERAHPRPAPVTAPVSASASIVAVTLTDGMPFSITLAEDIPQNAEEGTPLHFTVAKDVRVGDLVVIAKGAAVTGAIAQAARKGKSSGSAVAR